MPYIPQHHRDYLTVTRTALDPGRLNYQITTAIKNYLEEYGTNYATMNDIVGVLESAKLEFYRRIVGPYEDTKIEQNGDVY